MLRSHLRSNTIRTVVSIAAVAVMFLVASGPFEVAAAASEPASASCLAGAAKAIGTIGVATGLFVLADIFLFGGAMTITALAAGGAASIGVGAAATALALKGGMVAASMGCASSLIGH